MRISDIDVISFRTERQMFRNGTLFDQTDVRQTITKVSTDEGVSGYCFGGNGHGDRDGLSDEQQAILTGRLKQLVLGQDPFDRERIWQWMWTANLLPENVMSVLDLALWDLQGRAFQVPVHKLLGGCRERVKAYASSFPNLGVPDVYAQHALDCKARGYTAYKIHPYYFWDPKTKQADPGRPSHIDYDIAACRLIREAVGPDMTLMFDPWGTYHTFEEALKVGRALEDLEFYWFEHPMPEYRVESYRKLADALDIPVLSPEIAPGSVYTRADWIFRGASDMSRIDVLRGGITGSHKLAGLCEAVGVKLEMHMSGFGNLQILGATSEDVCEYYERGLEGPGLDYDEVPPYWKESGDPMDADGFVRVPEGPGLGYQINWDYIDDHRMS